MILLISEDQQIREFFEEFFNCLNYSFIKINNYNEISLNLFNKNNIKIIFINGTISEKILILLKSYSNDIHFLILTDEKMRKNIKLIGKIHYFNKNKLQLKNISDKINSLL